MRRHTTINSSAQRIHVISLPPIARRRVHSEKQISPTGIGRVESAVPTESATATSSLGIQTYFESKSLARFCCELLNLQHLAESAFFKSLSPNEAQTRQSASLEPSGLAGLH